MSTTPSHGDFESGQEHTEPDTRRIWLYIISTLTFLVLFQIFAYYWFLGMKDAELRAKQIYSPERTMPSPEEKAADSLETYRWLDPEESRVKIPVSRAMELMVDSANAEGKK